MSKFKVLALTATLILATAGLSMACDKSASSASAETAKASGCASGAAAETAAAKSASAAGCASGAAAQTAAVKTAGAEGCATGAAVKTAGAEGCATGAAVKTAGAEGCSKTGASSVKLETVRMPSGAMAVFYHGTTPEAVAFLQSKAEAGCGGFVCDMARSMAADANVATEIAATDTGVMILVTAKDAKVVDGYEAQYAALSSSADQQGE